ncbi:Serine protease precursor MucD/AlgY associated with sigma factor RpoE [Minicystis rosea]|nr:Serine protease precursor MucD/AlgY associated with sigma factor RpoE [Minicystis rosea]
MMNRWFRLSSTLLATVSMGVVGCNQAHTPPVVQPQPETAATQAQPAPLPPIATTQLPPLPVPATFDVAALADQVKPMVVNITTTQKVTMQGAEGMDPFEFFFGGRNPGGQRERSMKRQAVGTGVIIDPGGYVVTNEHVIHDADDVRVHLADERDYKAEIVGRDPKLDIALLKIRGSAALPAAPMGSSDKLRVGEHVLAVGNPFGLGHTVTLGIVSAKARTIGAGPYDDFIQTDASINPGNSGGPLFNWRGEVIGINTAIRAGANGIGFAIPIDEVRDVLGQLRDKGKVERGRLGLGFQPISRDIADAMGLDSTKGALVSQIEPGGAAARAGIHAGDVILSVNGTTINHAEELPRRVARNAPGATIDLVVVHGKQRRDVKATLDALPDDPTPVVGRPGITLQPNRPAAPPSKLGISVSDAPGGGARVDEADGDSVRDLMAGDVIIEVNGAPVKDVAGLRSALSRAKPGTTALLKVRRGKATQFAAVPVPPANP